MLEDIIRKNCPPLAPLPTGMAPELNRLAPVKAMIFDIYGTLFVSGSGDVGTAAATNTAEALKQALVVSGYEGDLEQAGQVGIDRLTSEIRTRHKTGHVAGSDYPEVEICQVWKAIIDAMQNANILTTPETNAEQIQRLALEYECRVNPVFPMPESTKRGL